MPRHYEGPAQNYHNIDHFKETAVKTLNNLFARKEPFAAVDFAESTKDGLKYWHAVAYHKGEKLPEEQKAGEDLSQEQKDALTNEGGKGGEDDEADIHASEGAMKFAAVNNIDLSKVTGTGKDGKITQPDVAAYLKTLAPEKDKANGENGINV